MKIIESVIRKSLAQAVKRHMAISELLEANPLSDLIALRIAAQKEISAMPFDRPANSEFLEKVRGWAAEEKRLLKIAEDQQDRAGLIQEKVKLQSEIEDLHREIYYMERKKQP